jgi:hypothetical protein
MIKSGRNTVDFNSILMGLNLIVACLLGSAYSLVENNEFIDQTTILLGLVLSLQTHVALQVERARRDPFVILLTFITILYFSVRLYTLALYPFSNVFRRYTYGTGDSNFALLFIIIANMFLYAGFFCVGFRRNAAIDSRDWRPMVSSRVVVLMVISLIYSYFIAIYWTPETVPRVVDLFGIFISPPIILLMALSYFVLFRKTLDRKAAIAIGTLLLLEIVAHTLVGSRSGLVNLIQSVLLALLAISSSIKIRRSYFILGCALAPIVAALLIATFAISTFNRIHKGGVGQSIDLARAIEMAGEASAELGGDDWDIVLPPIFDRAGYFDYSAEIIAHADVYKDVFSLSTYAKSIIDNLLTPGFDVYDQPKVSNTLMFVYADMGKPSKEETSDYYQSDQFGIYGELYAVFGYASLPLFFLIAFLLKRFYVRLAGGNPFILTLKRIVILSIFVKVVNSYGMDWTIIEMVPFVVAIYLYRFFFRSRRLLLPERSPPSNDLDASPGVPAAI